MSEVQKESNIITEPKVLPGGTFRMSEDIGKISLALSKAQGIMANAHKDSNNPFFKSKYSDLASCWDACREPLAKNDLAIVQGHSISEKGDVVLTTLLTHSSGQFFEGTISIRPTKNDPQMYVAATTYGRRCGLCAMVGISPADDDGNSISGKASVSTSKPKPARKAAATTTKPAEKTTKAKGKSKPPVEEIDEALADDDDDDGF